MCTLVEDIIIDFGKHRLCKLEEAQRVGNWCKDWVFDLNIILVSVSIISFDINCSLAKAEINILKYDIKNLEIKEYSSLDKLNHWVWKYVVLKSQLPKYINQRNCTEKVDNCKMGIVSNHVLDI